MTAGSWLGSNLGSNVGAEDPALLDLLGAGRSQVQILSPRSTSPSMRADAARCRRDRNLRGISRGSSIVSPASETTDLGSSSLQAFVANRRQNGSPAKAATPTREPARRPS